MYLPEVEVKDETYFVTLEMVNKSIYEVDVTLKRKQLCDCSLKEVAVNINTTKKEFECVHREMLTVELAEPKFYVIIFLCNQSKMSMMTMIFIDKKFFSDYPNTNKTSIFRKTHNNY